MTSRNLAREEYLAKIRGWARPPYRQIAVDGKPPKHPMSGGGIVPTRSRAAPSALTIGGDTIFNNPGDAPPGTTTSFGTGGAEPYIDLLCVFWGAAWNTPGLSPGVGDIMAAVGALSQPASSTFGNYGYFDGLNAYSDGDKVTWGFSVAAPPLIISTNPPNNPFSQNDVQNEAYALYYTPFLGPGGVDNVFWNLIMFFMPPGFPNVASNVAGEHSYFVDNDGVQVNYAFVDYSTSLATITTVFSHELIETMTDPHGDGVQVNPRNATNWNEVCDVCASTGLYNGVTATSYFSSTVGACMIPSPPPPPLSAGDYLIDSVDKVREASGGERISVVSGPGNGGGRWILPEFDVVSMINANDASFHTMVDGVRANVAVDSWFLKSDADGFAPNNLDNLPPIP
jgi:hypothetical protein